jgi:hypothetical protein
MKSTELSKDLVAKAVETIKNHSNEFLKKRSEHADLTIEEVAQIFIIDKFNDAQIEAEEIVNDLKEGLANFDSQYNKNKETDSIHVEECLRNATSKLEDEERKNCYVNILTAIELLHSKELSEADVNSKLTENAKFSEDELLERITKVVDASISLDSIVSKVSLGLDSNILSQLSANIRNNKDEYKLMTAVWLYVLQREKVIKLSDSDFDMTAVQIGALAGAALETIAVNNDLLEGKIEMDQWQKYLKWILGAVIAILLGSLALLVVVNISLFAMSLILAILGTGTISLFLSYLVAICVAWHISDVMVDGLMEVLQSYVDFYNKNIEGITSKIMSWIEMLKDLIRNGVDKIKDTVDNIITDKEGQTENNQVEVTEETPDLEQPIIA